MKTRLFLLSVLGGLLMPEVQGFQPPKEAPLPNLDRRVPAAQASSFVAGQDAAIATLNARVPGLKVSRDALLGSPRLISAERGFLTGAGGVGRAVSAEAAIAFSAGDLNAPVKAFLNENASLFGHDASVLTGARISREYVTAHNGLRTVVWQQFVDDVPVFESLLIGHITRRGELVNLSSRFVSDPVQATAAASTSRATLTATPPISLSRAVELAAEALGGSVQSGSVQVVGSLSGGYKRQSFTAAGVRGEGYADLVWLPMNRDSLRLCWQIILSPRNRPECYIQLVDAESGAVHIRRCATAFLEDATYNVFTSDSPSPFSPGHPTRSTVQPALVNRQLVTISALSTNASPDGWISDGVNETIGNNVDAHTDRTDDDLPDLPRPRGNPARTFDFPLDLTQGPLSYSQASVVQLFYWNNFTHDKLYELGFTEAAGNFQTSNFGRGGIGNDFVRADAQDGGGFNNANMQTLPDGFPARMQMYLFDGPNPDRDGSLDGEVVIHEYVHGLSNRLVGGGPGIYELQPAGMGEGWSDFYGMALLSEAADDPNAVYAQGGYLSFELFGLRDNYYFGIRRYPYTTDMSKNPLTFKDIDPSKADPHRGIPINPVFGGGPADEVHNMGEVWCVMLWEVRASLIDKLGFTEGSQTVLQLVTDGMKLSPLNPTFVEARDAIILADEVLTGGANRAELWLGFAKRGLGSKAVAPPASTAIGVLESYELPDDIVISTPDGILEVTVTPSTRSALIASSTEPVFVRVTDFSAVTNATISATIRGAGTLSFRNDGVAPDITPRNAVYSASLQVPNTFDDLEITLVISAPGKLTATNVVTYSVIRPPTNDNFASATKIPVGGTVYLTSNKSATTEFGEPLHAGVVNSAASLWWRYTAQSSTNILIDTAGSTFNTVLAVYTNSTLQTLKVVASADDVGTRRQAFLKINVVPGVTYQIVAASVNPTGTGTLKLSIVPGGDADILAPIVRILSPGSGLFISTNRVLVSGSIEDPQPAASGIESLGISVNPGATDGSALLVTNPSVDTISAGAVTSTNWSRIVALREGLNLVQVSASDIAGNRSAPVTIQVTYRPKDPPNDLFRDAVVLGPERRVTSVNTLNATVESGEPRHVGIDGGKSAWWRFQAAEDGILFLSTTNSTFDTILAVYTGTKVTELKGTEIGSNDDAFEGSGFSKLSLPVRGGLTNMIAVDGFGGVSGIVFLESAFTPSVVFQVNISVVGSGTVSPGSSLHAANTPAVFEATPSRGFQFVRWEGDVTSVANPVSVVVTRNLNIRAIFEAVPITDDFENGLDPLRWSGAGDAQWTVVASGDPARGNVVRSGSITNRQSSSLIFRGKFNDGGGSFDYRVSSEAGWDFLEFYVDAKLVQRWSGDVAWDTFRFPVVLGEHTLEWRYKKDENRFEGSDVAFIDNLDLPLAPPINNTSRAELFVGQTSSTSIEIIVRGQTNQRYTIEASNDLTTWTPITTQVAVGGTIRYVERPLQGLTRFYRAIVAE